MKNKFNTPIVVSEHWTGYHKENNLYQGFLKKKFTEYVVRKTSTIHVVAQQLQYSMEAVGLKGNYTSIGNVVNTHLFQPAKKSIKDNCCRIIYVGNLIQHHKRILDLIQLIGQLTEQRTDFELDIYGEGAAEAECRGLIEQNQWKNRIHLKGTLDRPGIAKEMSTAHFLVLYSETENQPCVINEAQACGLPVVVPDIEGIVERMNKKLGIVFSKSKPQEFSDAVNIMIDQHHQYNREYIRSFAEQEYSELNIAKKFEALYLHAITKAQHQT